MAEKEEDIRVPNVTVLLIWFFCRDLPFTIKLTLLVFNKKICLKAKVKFAKSLFKQNQFRFAVFFPLPSCSLQCTSEWRIKKVGTLSPACGWWGVGKKYLERLPAG